MVPNQSLLIIFVNLDNQSFVDKTKDGVRSRRYGRGDLQSFSEIWKYQDERGQDFITVSTVSLNLKILCGIIYSNN